jgi:glycosyltransferase involved in cell wall biosynthesis
MPEISVIISTYNSPDWLEKVLTGYACQRGAPFEIVIADDGSGPETAQLIDRFIRMGQDNGRFRLTHVRHEDDGFRKWEIVNAAIAAASGDYLIFTDGDCIPHPDLVATHARLAAPGRFLSGGYFRLPMATSRAITLDAIRTGAAFRLGWLHAHGLGLSLKWLKVLGMAWRINGLLDRLSPAKKTFNGNNSSCWRTDALRVRGFDARIRYGGGDREFGYRLEHAGIAPKVIRYSTLCLHLDHPRGYKSAEIRAANMAIIDETRATGRIETQHGLTAKEAEC